MKKQVILLVLLFSVVMSYAQDLGIDEVMGIPTGTSIDTTLDPDAGAMFFNTTTNKLMVYDGATWLENSTSSIVSTDANNSISVGIDGGAYLEEAIFFDSYDETGGQTIVADSFTQININKERVNVTGFTLINDEITIPSDGYYEITYMVTLKNSSSSRSGAISKLFVNSSEISGSDLFTYHRIYNSNSSVSNQVSSQTGSKTVILELDQGDKISLWTKKNEGDLSNANGTNLRTVANGSGILIKRIK